MWNKKKNYIIEYQTQQVMFSIPLTISKPLQTFFISYTDLEMQGLKSAQLLCNLSGSGKFIIWDILTDSHEDRFNKTEERFLQNSSYSLYLSKNYLYVVEMNTAMDMSSEL